MLKRGVRGPAMAQKGLESMVQHEPEHVGAVVMPAEVVDEPAAEGVLQISIGVEDALLVAF